MVSEKVVVYIRDSLLKQVPEEKIVGSLRKVGISPSAIATALKKAKKDLPKSVSKAAPLQAGAAKQRQVPVVHGRNSKQTGPSQAAKNALSSKADFLHKYVSVALSKQVDSQTIRKTLLQAKYTEQQIQQAISAAQQRLGGKAGSPQSQAQRKAPLHTSATASSKQHTSSVKPTTQPGKTATLNRQQYLERYVQSALHQKVNLQAIRKVLLQAKYSEQQIQQVINTSQRKTAASVPAAPNQNIHKQQPVQPQSPAAQSPAGSSNSLEKYVESALSRSVDRETIRKTLLAAKWDNAKIQKIFDEHDKKKEPAPVKKTKEDLQNDEESIRKDKDITIKEEYHFSFMDINVKVILYQRKGEPTPTYHMIIPVISGTTNLILEEIRLKLIDQINLGTLDLAQGDFEKLDTNIQDHLIRLVAESFPHVDENTQRFLVSYLISRVLGLGIVEIIKADDALEEIVINNSVVPVYVYHKKWGWCKSNQFMEDDDHILHLESMTGRKIGREITTLEPLLDAHLPNGDRVNATLKEVTADGPTMTIRKFSNDPWTITKFLKTRTMDYSTAAIIWLAIQFEMSMLVVGGTASGKTSCLNVLTHLIPPSQRVITIEDTREIRLPKYMHWVPMISRPANAEGKGGVEMEDLLVNSLRMRPDRIIVGEVRKKEQAETLFEAIHTGHSVYATFHANDATEAIVRLTNPPVSVPKTMMPAISLLVVQYRNRRSGLRRTFQVAEITKSGDANVLYQYNAKDDKMEQANKSVSLFENLQLYTGNSYDEINEMVEEKIKVLKYLVEHDMNTIQEVGNVMALYYAEKDYLFKEYINKNKKIGVENQ